MDIPGYWTVPSCPYLHGRPEFGPSCTEFVYPGCWHSYNDAYDATSMIDDFFTEHGGLLHVLPLTVHLDSETFLFFRFVCGTPPSCSKVKGGWVVVVASSILVSAKGPLVLGFGVLGLKVWGQGLTINSRLDPRASPS